MPDEPTKIPLKTVVSRGWKKRCPRCGEGEVFVRFMTTHKRCGSCDLQLEPNPGDTWAFWTIGDRVFVMATLIALFFGFRPENPWIKWSWLALLVVSFIITMPARMGVCIGLDYYMTQRGAGK